MTKILVTGSGGQLGSELQILSEKNPALEFTFTDVADLDITREENVMSFFRLHKFDFCVNCAAYTAVDKAEEDREKCDLINITGVANLAEACQAHGAALIHISTDFVFNGTAYRPLREDDGTNPVSYYGLSKLKGEQAVQQILNSHIIIRTSWLHSAFGGNFVKTMLQLAKTKTELNVIADQVGSPTYARDLAQTVITIIEKENPTFGLYHYSNEGTASWYDLAVAVFEYADIAIKVNPIRTEQYPTPAKRPHYSIMDKAKIKSAFGVEIPHWRQSLSECLGAIRQQEALRGEK